MRRRLAEAARLMGGTLTAGDPGARWSGATLDSRLVGGGELFFALRGERTDGHNFVARALESGAAAAVVERPVEAPAGGALIRVPDTFAALRRLAEAMRRAAPFRLIGVTGSTGKTSTKELLATLLARRFRVGRSPGNLNNLLGFPVALLGQPEALDWMVAELGMSTPGELGTLSRLARPDGVVLTNVRPVHLEFFDSVRAIAEAKAEVLEGLSATGFVVANADDPEVERIARRWAGTVVWYGLKKGDVVARDLAPSATGGTTFRIEAAAGSATVRLPLHGFYNVENFLAAAACALHLGVSLEEIAAAAAGVTSLERRGVVHRLGRGIHLIDDVYNANPDAVSRALESAAAMRARRRWAILGDMLELGTTAPAFHRRAGKEAAALGFSPVWGVGELARELARAAATHGAASRWFEDAAAAAAAAPGELEPGDLLLVKGSRGLGLEAVVDALRGARGGE